MVIRKFHLNNGRIDRNICLIPESAHGTNPASAVMAGMKVVVIKCDKHGNISERDVAEKVQLYSQNLAAMMLTYPQRMVCLSKQSQISVIWFMSMVDKYTSMAQI